MEQELFGELLNDEDIENELAQLDADIAEMDLAAAPTDHIKQQQPVHQEEAEAPVKQPEKRQLVAA